MKKNYTICIYINEFFHRSLYLFLNIFILALIFLYKYDTLFFIKAFPVILSKKKFISTSVTELLELWWSLVLSNIILFTWPLFTLQLSYFLRTGFYKFQLYFLNIICKKTFIIYFLLLSNYYFFIFPIILHVLFLWSSKNNVFTPLMFLEIKPNILSYINWISELQYLLSFFTLLSVFYAVNLILSEKPYCLLDKIKNYKRILLFLFILFLFILCPPDLIFNIFIPFFSFLILECLYFLSCFNIINKIKYKNAHIKTVTKKFTKKVKIKK